MPKVAEQLRQGREAMKLDIQQIAQATKLKADQIIALEEGNHDYFTAAVYLRGSVRTYSNLLKLDTPAVIAQLDEELRSFTKFAEDLPAPAKKKSGVDSATFVLSRLNWGVAAGVIILIVVILLGSAGYRAWKNRQSSDPLRKLGSGMYQPAEPGGEILPLPTNGVPKAASPG